MFDDDFDWDDFAEPEPTPVEVHSYRVDIVECSGQGHTFSGQYEAESDKDAAQAAIVAEYGAGSYLWRNNELAEIGLYGQIMKNLHGSTAWSARSLSGRVRLDVEELS
jgi:hypothetical protein